VRRGFTKRPPSHELAHGRLVLAELSWTIHLVRKREGF
jgi:hypothetical protein